MSLPILAPAYAVGKTDHGGGSGSRSPPSPPLLFLIYCWFLPPDSASEFWWLARTLRPAIVPDWAFPLSWAVVFIAHTGEGAYATILARRHHMPWHIAVSRAEMGYCASQLSIPQTAWVVAVTIFGIPVLSRLRHLIKLARIESIMKGN
jgi:hypothetical protein